MRSIGGTGANNGPFLAFHDGFVNMAQTVEQGGWDGFLNGWDRVAMDSHRYLCFSEPNNYGLTYQASLVCLFLFLNCSTSADRDQPTHVALQLLGRKHEHFDQRFRSHYRWRMESCQYANYYSLLALSACRLTHSSMTVNDCGKWLNNVGNGQRYDGTYFVPGNTTAPAFQAVGSCTEWNVSDRSDYY